jgi:signal transduction histidine kinase
MAIFKPAGTGGSDEPTLSKKAALRQKDRMVDRTRMKLAFRVAFPWVPRTIFARLAGVVAAFLFASAAAEVPLNPEVGVGDWIWAEQPYDRQECRFVRAFEIPRGAQVTSAWLRMTADNSYQLFLDGQPIGSGGDWRVLIEYNVKLLLPPGEHLLAVIARNDFDVAGLLFGLRVEMSDGRVIEVASDDSWKIAPNDVKNWQKKTRSWERWPAAKVLYPIKRDYRPQVYKAPVSQPLEIEFWQRKGFQIALLLIALISIAAGLFLGSRLFLKSRMERVVRRERERIAVDLHDDLGGGLTQLVLIGETSRREISADSQMAEALGRLCDQSRGLLRGMNETVWLINSQRDTVRDFASYVAKYAESFFQNSPVRCRFAIEDDLPPLPCDLGIRRNLFLAVKEALNNILRHSGATAAEVEIHRVRNELVVTIRDNGRGFDPSKTSDGNGLRNMAKRAREAGGQFNVESREGEGCAMEFRVPLLAPARFGVTRFFSWNRKRRPAE